MTKTKEGRSVGGSVGRSVTELAAAQTAPTIRKKTAGGAATGETKEDARDSKSAASQSEFDVPPHEDDATADTARDLPESSAITTNSKGLLAGIEILKMSDKDYMNEAQPIFSKDRLVKMHGEIPTNANQTVSNLRETVVVPGPADRATIEEEHALELRTRDHERKLLKKVERLIARIDAGDYGYCDETGEPIGMPRLIARPTASLTLGA